MEGEHIYVCYFLPFMGPQVGRGGEGEGEWEGGGVLLKRGRLVGKVGSGQVGSHLDCVRREGGRRESRMK